MKIAVVGPAHPLRGGIAQHVYLLYQHLAARGHILQVVSYKKLYPRFLFPGRSTLDASNLRFEANALPIIDTLNPLTWIKAYRQINRFAPDLVLFQWWNPIAAPAIGVLANLFKHVHLNCAIECHNVFPHEASPLDLPLTGFAFSPVTNFVVHSSADRETLLEQFPDKIVQVGMLPPPLGILDRSLATRKGHRILFFGLVRRYKGLDVLLAAMPKVLSQIDCRLSIVGEFYEEESRYRELIRRLGIGSSVEIDNRYVPNEEIGEVFERSDVLVLPYLSATQSAVAQLAIRSSLPIIASRTGGLAEIVIEDRNGMLVTPGDSEELANAIITYFANGLGPIFSKNMRFGEPGSEDIKLIEIIERFASGA